jgi:hypothetical protein
MNLWGLIELGRLAYAAAGLPLFVGLADVGERAAERFEAMAERYKGIDERTIEEILKAPLNNGRPYLKLDEFRSLPKPLAELREALRSVEGEAEKDAAVVATLVLYRALVENAKAYKEWAELYRWARDRVEKQEFIVTAEEVKGLREAHKRLEEVAEKLRSELNSVLASYSRSGLYKEKPDLYERLRPHLEVDWGMAKELAEARSDELSKFGGANMGTKAYAALLSIARGGAYGHAAMLLADEGALADIVISTPKGAYEKAKRIAKGRREAVDPSRSRKEAAGRWEDRAASALLRYLLSRAVDENLKFRRVGEGFEVFRTYGGVEARVDTLKIGKTAQRRGRRGGAEALRGGGEEGGARPLGDGQGAALPGVARHGHVVLRRADSGRHRPSLAAGLVHRPPRRGGVDQRRSQRH